MLERYPEDHELTDRLRSLIEEYGPKVKAAAIAEAARKAVEAEAADRLR